MNTRDTLKIENSHVEIGGVDSTYLAKKYGTPLYVLDVDYVQKIVDTFSNTIKKVYGDGIMLYASKALSCVGIYALLKDTAAGCDVVSGGELFTALSAGFSPDKIYMHGNNKSDNEIAEAIDANIHAIVIDSLDEIEVVDGIAKSKGKTARVMLRINPNVSAHTHEFVQTATEDSKFGLSIKNGSAIDGVKQILSCKNLEMLGLHTHIGSQIFEDSSFIAASNIMTDFLKEIKEQLNVEFPELNMGGGFGIYYEGEDKVFTLKTYAEHLSSLLLSVSDNLMKKGLKKPKIVVEPGRSIVGEAGITLYTVGNIKSIEGKRKYVCVDGGMFDNPRYALYGSRYSACIANRANEKADDLVTIAGKCCESGDIVAKDVYIQKAARGDILCVFSTGAYNYSMASNYNRNFVPPIVAVKNGVSEYLVKPQSYADLVRNDCVLKDIK